MVLAMTSEVEKKRNDRRGNKISARRGRLIDNGIIFLMYYQREVWAGSNHEGGEPTAFTSARRTVMHYQAINFACLLA